LPPYQAGDGFAGNNGFRTNPDVAAVADPATGVAVLDPYDFGTATPWVQVGGTSIATPLWAGMAAIADQGRVVAGGQPLGATPMLTDI
jgi:subtilase family serine protease